MLFNREMLILRLLVIATLLVIGPAIAKAAPLVFACYGQMRTLGPAGNGQRPWKDSLTLKVDLQADTITIGDYDPVPIMGKPSEGDDTIGFIAKPEMKYGVSTGLLNRITGALDVHILPAWGGLVDFNGVCKSAKRLF